MARSPTLLVLPLLLSLLLLFWASTRAEDRKVVLLAPPEVNGSRGNTVILACILQPVESEILRVRQIKWERLEPWGDPSTVAEYDWEQGPSIPEPDHVQFVAAGKDQDLLDASLTLTELEPDDDANYTCEVTTFQHGSGRARIWLQVFYSPQVSISLYDDIVQKGHREISLKCDARGNPKPRSYEWSTTTGPLPPFAEPHGAWLLLQPSEESINITFICHVSNTLGTAHIYKRVFIPGPPRKQSRSRLALLMNLIVGPMTVILVILIYFWCFRKFCQGEHRASKKKACLQNPLVRITSEPCRIEVKKLEMKVGTKAATKGKTEAENEACQVEMNRNHRL